jgi:hypothetical protein
MTNACRRQALARSLNGGGWSKFWQARKPVEDGDSSRLTRNVGAIAQTPSLSLSNADGGKPAASRALDLCRPS